MRFPDRWALAVRRPDGDIYTAVNDGTTLADRHPRFNKLFIRGIFALVDSFLIGLRALSVSARISLEELDETGSVEDEEHAEQKKLGSVELGIALVLALALFLGLFIVLPAVVVRQFDRYLTNTVVYNLAEGLMRISIFVLYLAAMSLFPDMRRLFEYHGAEHKVVHAYEAGLPLDSDSASPFTTIHIRCGTTFIVVVFVISILVFSLMGRPALWLRVVERLAVIPLVAAVSYEIIRLAGKKEGSRLVRFFMAPGLWLQRLTTREPDKDQMEVAVRALSVALGEVADASQQTT
ncbi:MAG: DUF1385 domain-containing protein [Actinobacteria bacterium]|nr:DUF1385 domain-containing protein [Actinomycetota bacterium]